MLKIKNIRSAGSSVYILIFVAFISAIFFWVKMDMLFLLLISISMGLYALMEMDVDWNEKKSIHAYILDFDKKRYPISISGKIAGFFSSLTLLAYLYFQYFG